MSNNTIDKKFLELAKGFKFFQDEEHLDKPIIEIKDLKKSFRTIFKKSDVLKGINLKIYKGDKIAFLGANGAGKTTFLEILSGINKQSSGTIDYNFEYLDTPYERIGIQFQDASCPAGLTVYDLIKIQNEIIQRKLTNSEIVQFVKYFNLEPILMQKANKLSGGQQQILNIGLSFMNNPDIILLDELSTALDVDKQFYVNKIVYDYTKTHNTTVLLASHNIREILFHTNRTIILKKGKIVANLSNDAILKRFKDYDFFLTNFLKWNND